MKSFRLKIFALSLTFTMGVSAAWIFSTFKAETGFTESIPVNQDIETPNSCPQKLNSTSPDGQIAINFIGFSSTVDGLIAEFEAVNHNNRSAYFSAYATDANETASLNPQFKVNGIHEEIGYCGTGLTTFELKPGESKKIQLYGQILKDYLDKPKNNVQVGYWFGFNEEKKYKLFWSKNLQIPDSIKVQLKAEEMELKKKLR